MEASFATLEAVKAIPLGGLNERIVPESIPINDLSKLIGLRQNRLGELLRYPGEIKIEDIIQFSSIRSIVSFGEYTIIQTADTLIRLRNSEIFPDFEQITPELFPDNYEPGGPTPPAINPELMSYALVNYQLTSGTAPASTLAASWQVVPLNVEVSDSDNRVSVAGNIVTITAGSYPAWVRIDGEVCITGPNQGLSGANSNQRAVLRLRQVSSATLAVGIPMRETTNGSSNEGKPVSLCSIKGRFQIAGSTDVQLQVYTTEATSFGREMTTGEAEVYAQLEILIEEP